MDVKGRAIRRGENERGHREEARGAWRGSG
jgi:hypothetical protein